MNKIACHSCKGRGKIIGIFPSYAEYFEEKDRKKVVEIPCQDCDATGQLPEKSKTWRILGEKLYDARISKRLTLNKASQFLGMDCIILGKMERGVIEPDPKLLLKILKSSISQ